MGLSSYVYMYLGSYLKVFPPGSGISVAKMCFIFASSGAVKIPPLMENISDFEEENLEESGTPRLNRRDQIGV